MENLTTPNYGQNQTVDATEIEKLVKKLYQPGLPQEIASTEKALQGLQRSLEGWRMADLLLQSQDPNVRFFGALTFTIKINQDWDSLNDADAAALFQRLVGWLIQLIKADERGLVLKKMCSALVAYYLRPSGVVDQCIRHLVASIREGHPIPLDDLSSQQPFFSSTVESLSGKEVRTILWLAGGLADEVNKISSSSIQTHGYSVRVSSNIGDVVDLLRHSMNLNSTRDLDLADDGVKCFHSWVVYTQRGWVNQAAEMQALRPLVPLVVATLQQESMYDTVTNLFTDIFNFFPTFLTANDFRNLSIFLSTDDTLSKISELKRGIFGETTLSFAKLLLAYGEAAVQDLAEQPHNPHFNRILFYLLDLLKCDGCGGVDDEVCFQALEFWTTYTEFVVESLFDNEETKPTWTDIARQRIEAVIEACWIKIRMPAHEIAVTWDSDARSGFRSFRKDVHDLLQTSYRLLGVHTVERLAQLVLQSLHDHAWLPLEATLFCLNALADVIADDDSIDDVFSKIATSSLFEDMTKSEQHVPAKTRETAVTMISNYAAFFERNAAHLAAMLNFLFESLKSPALANVAPRAIYSTCSSCRKILTSELDAFLQQYEVILTWESIGPSTKEKVIGAITSIIEALPSDEDKVTPLALLISSIEKDALNCVKEMEASQAVESQAKGVSALRCLIRMGKALQTPDEVAIDVDAEESNLTFWTEGQGAPLQSSVIGMLRTITAVMNRNSDIIEAGCHVLRVGYRENTPGLFVFPVNVTVDFVLASTLDTARLDCVLDTAGILLVSRRDKNDGAMINAASSFMVHMLGLVALMGHNPCSDPEISAAIIDLTTKMVPRYIISMINTPNIQVLLDFILRAMTTPDIMPRRSADHFWAIFVHKHDVSEESANFVRAAMDRYGPHVCRVLVTKIAGEANRSELDELAEPLKKIVFTQVSAKAWLSAALDDNNFPSQIVGPVDKRMWLKKIISLRGAKGTNQVVRDFWIQCRGSRFAYTS